MEKVSYFFGGVKKAGERIGIGVSFLGVASVGSEEYEKIVRLKLLRKDGEMWETGWELGKLLAPTKKWVGTNRKMKAKPPSL